MVTVTWVADHPMLLNVSERSVVRELDMMMRTRVLLKKGDDYFWNKTPQWRSVIVGSRPISSDPRGICGPLHLGLKICQGHPLTDEGQWTEVQGKFENSGQLVLDTGCPAHPVGVSIMGVSSPTGTPPERFLGYSGKTDAEMMLFKRTYVKENPKYGIGNNCRHYVSALATFLGTPL